MEASKTLSETYAAKRDFPRAYEYQLAYSAHRYSLFNTENIRSINEMAAKYEAERREQKIALLEKEQLLQTQAQLIHAEKMVTLGEMTAGLAHEIKNPLNFVTNFSHVANEMLTDLEHAPDDGTRADITAELRENLGRIREHGLRADTIVKGMMLHARGVAGERIRTDVNAVVEDAVELAYQGMLAVHGSADVTLVRDYSSEELGAIIVPQEIGRVVLNLVNNAIYAVRERPSASGPIPAGPEATAPEATASEGGSAPPSALTSGAQPTVWISTALHGGNIEIRIRDNGPGIPNFIQQKIFQPFFTTKPTGEGTGLGLSMSYDIVVNGHGGTIRCENSDDGAAFIIELPA